MLIKFTTLFLAGLYFFHSCKSDTSKIKSKDKAMLLTLTPEQEASFDALNSLQMQTQGHLYSTFADLKHDCFPPDSSFVISRAELLIAMEEFLTKYCNRLTIEEYGPLAVKAVQAQEDYLVEQCYVASMQMVDGTLESVLTKAPRSGIWILPNVIDRRDVILKW